jgi:hypothetical protein
MAVGNVRDSKKSTAEDQEEQQEATGQAAEQIAVVYSPPIVCGSARITKEVLLAA